MATTKIGPIKTTLNKALEYILNPEKTDGGMLVSSQGCTPETAYLEFAATQRLYNMLKPQKEEENENLAYHIKQNFKPNEVTPEVAHHIGVRLAKEMFPDYDCVVTTHIDKGHIHNHIMFNAFNRNGQSKYNDCKKTYWQFRKYSDKLCLEYGLSVVQNPQKRGMKYSEWQHKKDGDSRKLFLTESIDKAIEQSASYSDFLLKMYNTGFDIEQKGKYLKFRGKGQKYFTRAKAETLGTEYTREKIKERIEAAAEKPLPIAKITEIPLDERLKQASNNYSRLQSTKKLAAILQTVYKEGITNFSDFDLRIEALEEQRREIKGTIAEVERKNAAYREAAKYILTYSKYVDLYKRYENAFSKRAFRNKYESQLLIFEHSKEKLEALNLNPSNDLEVIQSNIINQENSFKDITNSFKEIETRLSQLKISKQQVQLVLEEKRPENKRPQEKERE